MKIILENYLKIPRLLRFIFIISISLTAFFIFLRLSFYVIYENSSAPISSGDFWKSLWIGSRFDLRIAVMTILPIFLVGWIKWFNPFYSKINKYIYITYLTTAFSFILILYIIDFGHYDYLGERLNFTATRFMDDAKISSYMLWESYPVIWILLAYISGLVLFTFLTNKLYEKLINQTSPQYKLWKLPLIATVSSSIVLLSCMSKFSQYPLRWSDATFSEHPFTTQFTYNPVQNFFDTIRNGRMDYDIKEAKKHYEVISNYLQTDQKKPLNYIRKIHGKNLTKKPNIILVIVESFASYKTSLDGNPLDPTPSFKKLADEGYYFNNFFTPSTGTARSIWTTITSMPDVEKVGTSSRNPLIVDNHSIANEFDGYEKFYFIGGSASWGNIRGILTRNIKNLHLYEDTEFNSPRNDVWGVSDIDLFREADNILKNQEKPFFAIIQTSGNHRPYTIPENSYGFKTIDIDEKDITPYGFESLKEYNAYRLMDYSINHFMEKAKSSGYAEDTVFFFWGDHGINGNSKAALKADNNTELNLGSLRVPFVIWSPELIKKPKKINKVASEVDVLATVAGFTGQSYTATTFGRDLFDEKYDNSRYAFTIVHSNPQHIGLVGQDYWFRMFSDGTEPKLHSLLSDKPKDDVSKNFPEQTHKMKTLTKSIYETTKYMYYFNKNFKQ